MTHDGPANSTSTEKVETDADDRPALCVLLIPAADHQPVTARHWGASPDGRPRPRTTTTAAPLRGICHGGSPTEPTYALGNLSEWDGQALSETVFVNHRVGDATLLHAGLESFDILRRGLGSGARETQLPAVLLRHLATLPETDTDRPSLCIVVVADRIAARARPSVHALPVVTEAFRDDLAATRLDADWNPTGAALRRLDAAASSLPTIPRSQAVLTALSFSLEDEVEGWCDGPMLIAVAEATSARWDRDADDPVGSVHLTLATTHRTGRGPITRPIATTTMPTSPRDADLVTAEIGVLAQQASARLDQRAPPVEPHAIPLLSFDDQGEIVRTGPLRTRLPEDLERALEMALAAARAEAADATEDTVRSTGAQTCVGRLVAERGAVLAVLAHANDAELATLAERGLVMRTDELDIEALDDLGVSIAAGQDLTAPRTDHGVEETIAEAAGGQVGDAIQENSRKGSASMRRDDEGNGSGNAEKDRNEDEGQAGERAGDIDAIGVHGPLDRDVNSTPSARPPTILAWLANDDLMAAYLTSRELARLRTLTRTPRMNLVAEAIAQRHLADEAEAGPDGVPGEASARDLLLEAIEEVLEVEAKDDETADADDQTGIDGGQGERGGEDDPDGDARRSSAVAATSSRRAGDPSPQAPKSADEGGRSSAVTSAAGDIEKRTEVDGGAADAGKDRPRERGAGDRHQERETPAGEVGGPGDVEMARDADRADAGDAASKTVHRGEGDAEDAGGPDRFPHADPLGTRGAEEREDGVGGDERAVARHVMFRLSGEDRDVVAPSLPSPLPGIAAARTRDDDDRNGERDGGSVEDVEDGSGSRLTKAEEDRIRSTAIANVAQRKLRASRSPTLSTRHAKQWVRDLAQSAEAALRAEPELDRITATLDADALADVLTRAAATIPRTSADGDHTRIPPAHLREIRWGDHVRAAAEAAHARSDRSDGTAMRSRRDPDPSARTS